MKPKIVLCDDDGNLLTDSTSTAHTFDLGDYIRNEIEQAVEQFRYQALPNLDRTNIKYSTHILMYAKTFIKKL